VTSEVLLPRRECNCQEKDSVLLWEIWLN